MAVGKQKIINWFKDYMGNPEVDFVDDAYLSHTRHVCIRGNSIELLPKQVYNLSIEEGVIPIEYYRCNLCGKLIINRNFM